MALSVQSTAILSVLCDAGVGRLASPSPDSELSPSLPLFHCLRSLRVNLRLD
jgi:hypothetical protein